MSGNFNTNCPGSLFWQGELLEVMQEQSRRLCAEVDGHDREFLLNANFEEASDSLAQNYALEPVKLHREKTELIEHGQTSINQQNRTCLIFFDPCLSRDS